MRKLMQSLRLRLTLFFVLVTTVTLGAFGVFTRHQLAQDLERRHASVAQGVVDRLLINLPGPLWNFDLAVLEKIVAAEMPVPEVSAVFVQDSRARTLVGFAKNEQQQLFTTLDPNSLAGEPLRSPIFKLGDHDKGSNQKATPQADGYLLVYFSRAPIEQALQSDFKNQLLQIFVVDLVLLLFLVLGLGLVFRPLRRLRDAQFALARQSIDDMKELKPIHVTEIDELTHGFNGTMSKLKEVIALRTQAQAAAQAATAETRQVLDKLVAAQEELVKAGKLAALGRLVGGIAHELNTPIGNGLMAASTLIDELKGLKAEITDKGPRRSSFERFLASVENGMEITMHSLTRSAKLVSNFKQISMDKSCLRSRHFALSALVRTLIPTMASGIDPSRYRIEIDVAENIELDNDPDLLTQLLEILVDNAIVHGLQASQGGVIRVSATRAQDGHVLIRVKDNGCGIPEGNLHRVFDPFFTTRLGQGGSGLGLYIAHNIVTEVLNGRLSVLSQVGEGTEFIVDIPCVVEPVV